MKSLIRLLLKSQQKSNQSELNHGSSGFTLLELLIAMIMTFLILTPLLAFVVDVLNTDRKEQVKTNTEQDMQAAVDFITQDLSQAVYIYDNDGVKALITDTFIPSSVNQVPILVFWKRRLLRDSLPVQTTTAPKACDITNLNDCDDTYVSSLVAYYQFKDKSTTWCQPDSSAANCPTRIVRYEVNDGLRDPNAISTDPDYPYYSSSKTNTNQQKAKAFNQLFDLTKPTEKVTVIGQAFPDYSVLVNNIDHSTVPLSTANKDCHTILNVTDPASPAPAITNTSLLISDGTTNSFYACVDKSRNLARIYIRGNALRRMDPNAKYSASNPAFFPTATAQIKGLSSPGQ
jgi:type II secretory pathway pseudopilin PulG